MRSFRAIVTLIVVACAGVLVPAVAHAAEPVTYEVWTESPVPTAVDIEYTDLTGKVTLRDVVLPWRMNAVVADAQSLDTTLRVTWQSPIRYKWLISRIFTRGSMICESIRDAGEASCTGRGLYGGEMPQFLPPVAPPGCQTLARCE